MCELFLKLDILAGKVRLTCLELNWEIDQVSNLDNQVFSKMRPVCTINVFIDQTE